MIMFEHIYLSVVFWPWLIKILAFIASMYIFRELLLESYFLFRLFLILLYFLNSAISYALSF